MTPRPDPTPRFQWRHRQDEGWGWSSSHTVEGPCSGCCPRDALSVCPRCGGRLHRDIAIIDAHVGGALFCQQERVDGAGRPARMRSAESQARIVARLEAQRRERDERLDRWIGRLVGGVLAVKLLLAVALVMLVVFGFVVY